MKTNKGTKKPEFDRNLLKAEVLKIEGKFYESSEVYQATFQTAIVMFEKKDLFSKEQNREIGFVADEIWETKKPKHPAGTSWYGVK